MKDQNEELRNIFAKKYNGNIDRWGNVVYERDGHKLRIKIMVKVIRHEVKHLDRWLLKKSYSLKKIKEMLIKEK